MPVVYQVEVWTQFLYSAYILKKTDFSFPPLFYWILGGVIIMAGSALRLWHLNKLPCGISPDEADILLQTANLGPAVMYDNPNNEVEGFFSSVVYVVRQIVAVIDGNQVFVASAILGSITLLLTLMAVRKHFGYWVGLLTTSILAFTPWHLALSQSGTRTVTTPLFLSLLLLTIPQETIDNWSFQKKKIVALLLGFVTAGGWYGYLNYRAMPLVFFVAFVLQLIRFWTRQERQGRQLRKTIQLWLLGAIGMTVGVSPLLLGYLTKPELFYGRMQQVAIIGDTGWRQLSLYGQQLLLTVHSLFVKGSPNWHHTLKSKPYIWWVYVPFLVLGLAWFGAQSWKYIRGVEQKLVTATIFPAGIILLLPVFMTSGYPVSSRMGGMLMISVLCIAVGIKLFIRFLASPRSEQTVLLVLALGILIVGGWRASSLMISREKSPQYAIDYFCDIRSLAQFIKSSQFLQILQQNDIESPSKIVIIGDWFDTAPIWYYLWQRPNHLQGVEVSNISLEEYYPELVSSRELVIVPAYAQADQQRLYTGIADPTSVTLVHLNVLARDGQLQEIYRHQHHNNSWFPSGVSFVVFYKP